MIPGFLEFVGLGRPPKAEFRGRGPYGIFETRDKKYLTLGVVEDHFWFNLCRALGLNDLASDKGLNSWQSRNKNRGRIVPRLKDAFKEDDLESWIKKLREMNVPVAPVLDFNNWMEDPQFVHRGFIPKTEKGTVDLGKLRRFLITSLSRRQEDTEQPLTLGRDNGTVLQR
jgi:crotonobetainyl-CoA:carnitine CoA-transferase CaiB-like acyl-CoA transferase